MRPNMCGIAGIYDRHGTNDASAVSRMLDVQAHRGPDGCGTWADPGIVLGHRRLAFLDLSHEGAQPMQYGEDRYVITYNGEVYNYVELRDTLRRLGHEFRSTSDTEVLLAAYAEWGPDCLSRFNGMFAFAIWDRRERSLFVARDRLGIKPLTYTWDGRRFGFASESKALHAAGLAPGGMNPDAVYEYLARGYTSEGRSFHGGVHVLEPGTAIMLGENVPMRTWQWWSPERSEDAAFGDAQEWSEAVGELLDDAVRIRLRADVPVGAHLSGGLDSSALTAAAARHHAGSDPFHTFTGAFTDDAASDERRWARAVAAHAGVEMHEVEIGVDELADEFARILWHMDEPIAGPGVFPQLKVCDLVARERVKAVLGGQGGDELFGGYLRHRALYWKRRMGSAGPMGRAGAAIELARMARGEWRRVRRTSTRASDGYLDPEFLASVDPMLREQVRRGALAHADVRELLWHDLRCYLPGLLHVEDRTSMAASIESRTPLLDYRLVELALRIPSDLLFEPGNPKPLLRSAVADWLPREVVQRRDKKGFPTPLHWWRERPALRDMVLDLTIAGRPESAGGWSSPGAAGSASVFSADYLAGVNGFQPSELWTVLTVNGWLSHLGSGAFARPRSSGSIPSAAVRAVA
ncbi:MAG: asparagine synthase (glutamine-hydrolyzing) [Thermoleophilia bacterium]|nr:asparagine synthase (glutamine-hydrolyzing) [Thermoleophilia bacterium]